MGVQPSAGARQSGRPIIVPLDGSAHALAALPVASALAQLEGSPLHIIHVARRTLPPREVLRTVGLTLEQFRGSILDQRTGAPAEGIVHFARTMHSQMIVLCTRTGLPQTGYGLGRVAEEVLGTAPCPVVLVRPERGLGPWALHQILLPHDGTPTSVAAIHPAVDLADQAGAALLVLHVAVPGRALPTEPGTFSAPRYLDQPQHEWPTWVREFLDRICGLGHVPAKVKLHLFLATGEAGDAIVRFATDHQSDLIVLAWRGHLEEKRAATMKAIIAAAPCPVLVVRVEE